MVSQGQVVAIDKPCRHSPVEVDRRRSPVVLIKLLHHGRAFFGQHVPPPIISTVKSQTASPPLQIFQR
jgi:hypothetical protein